ncbi:hypothetical protein [Bacillus sp. Au-Bac7]|uniref:hypothetical protein n=1 Tax=Bacillus sp. Au-Bac7 TaxID=2906458 RepID=UPI001E526CD7|nr:hypothetical protein [Bacillus sp. Au-Bac7]MCE4052031.1 hypothetical protein [Bacillus sp. Au-Bac7]
MASLAQEIQKIRTAQLGVDVRKSLADGLDAVNKETIATTERQNDLAGTFKSLIINAGNSNAETAASRYDSTTKKSYATLPERLDDLSLNTVDNTQNINDKGYSLMRPPVPLVGATGDGVSDDTSAFWGLVNWVQNNGKGVIDLGINKFYLKGIQFDPKTWKEYNQVRIKGGNGYFTQIIVDDDCADILFDMGGYTVGTDRKQTSWITFENFRLTCKATDKYVRAFNYDTVQYCNMKNIWIEGFKDGAIIFNDAYDCTFEGVQIINCGRAVSDTDYAYPLGFYGTSDCSNHLKFIDLRVEFCPLFCEFDNGARHIFFDNYKFEKMALNLTDKARPFNFISYRELNFGVGMIVNSDHYMVDSEILGVLGAISAGSTQLTVNVIKSGFKEIAVGDFITIVGVSGTKRITAINGTVLTLDSSADKTVSNAAVVGSYYIVDQGKDFFNFSNKLFYDGYDITNNLLKSAIFTNVNLGCPSKTSTRWGRFAYCKFDSVTFNNCEGGAVVDRCFNLYDEVSMRNVSMSSFNDGKLINLYGKNCNLDITNVKLVKGALSLVTVRTGAENNNVTFGSIMGATLEIPIQADATFYLDQANSRYFYLKNNKISLLSYSNVVDNDNKPSAWMNADIIECASEYPIEYINFGHNGKRVTLIYMGTAGSIKYNSKYMVPKEKADKPIAFGDTISFICHNGVWREI